MLVARSASKKLNKELLLCFISYYYCRNFHFKKQNNVRWRCCVVQGHTVICSQTLRQAARRQLSLPMADLSLQQDGKSATPKMKPTWRSLKE